MIGPHRHQVLGPSASVAAIGNSGNSPYLQNLTQDVNPVVVVDVSCASVVTNLIVNTYAVDDDGNQYLLGTLTVVPGTLQQRGVYTNVLETQLYFTWTPTGGTATGVDI